MNTPHSPAAEELLPGRPSPAHPPRRRGLGATLLCSAGLVASALLGSVLGPAAGSDHDIPSPGGSGPSGTEIDGAVLPWVPTPAELDGRRFLATRILLNGVEIELVEGTWFELDFAATTFRARAGCNHLSGGYSIEGEVLATVGPASTLMLCHADLMEQEALLAGFLASSPSVSFDGDKLTSWTDSVTVEFVDREIADPDRPLLFTRWTVTATTDESGTRGTRVDEAAWIELRGTTLVGFDGCGPIRGVVEYPDNHGGGPDDSEERAITFVDVESEDPSGGSCNQGYQERVVRVFETPDATFSIDRATLEIRNAQGQGVILRAETCEIQPPAASETCTPATG